MKFQLTATQIALVVGFVLPLLTSLLTKAHASSGVKAVANLALAAIGGWFATATSQSSYDLKTVLIATGTAFVMSVAAYLGFHKPVGTTTGVNNVTGAFGVG